jgi:hypothetical protein
MNSSKMLHQTNWRLEQILLLKSLELSVKEMALQEIPFGDSMSQIGRILITSTTRYL